MYTFKINKYIYIYIYRGGSRTRAPQKILIFFHYPEVKLILLLTFDFQFTSLL